MSGQNIDHLDGITGELKSIFAFIDAYKPDTVPLDYRLQPFIPDFIPSIGDIDPIMQVYSILSQIPPPDKIADGLTQDILPEQIYLGLKFLDEPHIEQSDPAGNSSLNLVVDFALRSFFVGQRLNGGKPQTAKVRAINLHGSEGDSGAKAIQSWLNHVKENYSTRSTHFDGKGSESEIECLMAQWPTEIDQAISNDEVGSFLMQIMLPGPDMDLTLNEYMQLCCNILDIPINHGPKKKNARIQAVGQLILLYSAFKSSSHFG